MVENNPIVFENVMVIKVTLIVFENVMVDKSKKHNFLFVLIIVI